MNGRTADAVDSVLAPRSCPAPGGPRERMTWLEFFTVGRGLPLTFYVALQIGALLSVCGRWRIAVAAPLVLVLLVFGNAAWTSLHGGRMALMMILRLIAPGAGLAIVIMWLTEVVSLRRIRSAAALAVICGLAVCAAVYGQNGISVLWRGGWTIATAMTLLALGSAASQIQR